MVSNVKRSTVCAIGRQYYCTIIFTWYTSAAYEQRGVSDTCYSSPSGTEPDSALQGQSSTNSSRGKGSGHIKSKPIPLKRSHIRQPRGHTDDNKGQLIDPY